ncbi:uncharacterized protein LOC134788728 [Penaeus indicus]|uniref:uncharacterized protein LOC134788728 n=1 Tax=Penaeus indicus TaxID=29960 RepID=UPI00300D3DD1
MSLVLISLGNYGREVLQKHESLVISSTLLFENLPLSTRLPPDCNGQGESYPSGLPPQRTNQEEARPGTSGQREGNRGTRPELGGGGSDDDGSEPDALWDNIFSFVIHGRDLRPSSASKCKFAFVRHGTGTDREHIHVVFSAYFSNKWRTVDRIGQAFGLNETQIAIAKRSLISVRNPYKYAIYLSRAGIRGRWVHYNGGVQVILDFLTEYQGVIEAENIDVETGLTYCGQQLDKLREERSITRSKIKTYDVQLDQCMDLFNKYRPLAPGQIKNKIPPSEKMNMFRIYGPYYANVLKNCHDMWLQMENDVMRNMSYLERLRYVYKEDRPLTEEEHNMVYRFVNIIEKNNIKFKDFIAKFCYVFNGLNSKIHGFVIQGVSNAGKSLVAKILLHNLHPTKITKNSSGNNFRFSRLPDSNCVLWEEASIPSTEVDLWKSILGGEAMETDVKHQDHQEIPNIPWIITTNREITERLEGEDRASILNRIFKFRI